MENYTTEMDFSTTLETHLVFAQIHPGPHKFIQVCETVIIPVILIIAVFTNVMCLVILPRTKITNTFKTSLVALTVSDLFNAVFSLVAILLELICFEGDMEFGVWSPPAVTTFAMFFISNAFLGISASIVISIVFIRHTIVTKPLSVRKHLTPRRIKVISCCLFLVNLILFTPTTFTIVWQSCYNTPDVPTCKKWNDSIPHFESVAKYYPYILTVLYGPVMVIVYIVCFVRIHTTLKKANKDMSAIVHRKTSVAATKIRLKKTSRTTRTLLFILVLDIICLIPICVLGLALVIAPKETVYSETNAPYKIFDTIGEILTAMRPAYNFWLYAFTQNQFRYVVKNLCCQNPAKKDAGKELSSGQKSTCTSGDTPRTGTPILGRGQITTENSLQMTDEECDSNLVEETRL